MRKITRQAGFAHTVVVAAVVAVLAVGGVGYLVVSRNDSKNSGASSTSVSSSASSSKSADEKAVKAAAKEHFALVYAKKYQEAYNNATCQEFRELASYEKFQSGISSSSGFQAIDLSAVEYNSVDIRNNQAAIKGPVGPLSPNETLNVSLLKKDSQWCIYGYSIE